MSELIKNFGWASQLYTRKEVAMFKQFSKNVKFNLCSSFILSLIILRITSLAQIPLSYSDIVDAFEKKLPEQELITKIEEQKVDFYLKSSDSADLLLNGASDQLIKAIETNRSIDKLPITFNGWKPFGTIAIAPWENHSVVLCRGSSNVYPGLITRRTFNIGNRRVLVVKMEKTGKSSFTDQNKMLKVCVSESDEAIKCATESLQVPDDREFVIKQNGEFRYRIPESLILGGTIKKLRFQFGPGRYKTFRISAWFE